MDMLRDDEIHVTVDVLPLDRPFTETWRMRFRDVLVEIEKCRIEGGEWCTAEKAATLASLIIGLRPKTVVEIGIWMGGSFVPMAMAMKAVGHDGKIVGIDPWSSQASVQGQHGANEKWWGEVDHEVAYRHFMGRLEKSGLLEVSDILRMWSQDAPVPESIGLLHIDGNHGPAVLSDVRRFALPAVSPGGIVFMDDVGWEGGHVEQAIRELRGMGFVELYTLDTGAVFQRVR